MPDGSTLVPTLERNMSAFDVLLMNQNAMDASKGPLHVSWHFLQRFSAWGLRLSDTEERLRSDVKLAPDAPNPYKFFPKLLDGNKRIQKSCRTFQEKVFPGMVGVAVGMLSYAELAAATDDDTGTEGADLFGIIKTMVEVKQKDEALALLEVLHGAAKENIEKAKEVDAHLGAFKADLEEAQKVLGDARTTLIEEDEGNDQAILDLMGDPTARDLAKIEALAGKPEEQAAERKRQDDAVLGEIGRLRRDLSTTQDDYEHYVTVAATSPTYAWLNVPPVFFGLVAAVVVASVYGPKATAAADKIDELQRKIETKSSELQTKMASAGVLDAGRDEIEASLVQVKLAIGHNTQIMNSWTEIQKLLASLKNFLAAGTAGGKLSPAVNTFLDLMTKSWTKLYPMLQTLTTNPHIVVEPDGFTLEDIAGDLRSKAELASSAGLKFKGT